MDAAVGVVIVAATLAVAASAPPDVRAEATTQGSAPSTGAAMRVSINSEGGGDAPLESFLRQRLLQAFGSGADAGRNLLLTLSWQGERGLDVRIEEAGELWARRHFTPAERQASELRLMLWLFVRSTLLRAQAREMPPAPDYHALAAPPLPASQAALPKKKTQRLLSPWLLAGVAGGPTRLWSLGVAGGVDVELASRLALGGELGYRLSSYLGRLVIHRLPVRLRLGLRTRPSVAPGRGEEPWQAELAACAVVEPKLASSRAQERLAVGYLAGMSAQVAAPLLPGKRTFVLVRLSQLWGIVRQRYVLASGRVAEPPWLTSLELGVAWR